MSPGQQSVVESALERAIRAEESAKAAHHRLDRMNGSIDRLGDEVAQAKTKASEQFTTIDEKVDLILQRLAHEDGQEEGEASARAAQKARVGSRVTAALSVANTAAVLIGGIAGAFATYIAQHL